MVTSAKKHVLAILSSFGGAEGLERWAQRMSALLTQHAAAQNVQIQIITWRIRNFPRFGAPRFSRFSRMLLEAAPIIRFTMGAAAANCARIKRLETENQSRFCGRGGPCPAIPKC